MADYLNRIIKYARIADISLSLVLLVIGLVTMNFYFIVPGLLLMIATGCNYQKWLLTKLFNKK